MVAKNVQTKLLQPEIVNSGTKSINVLDLQFQSNLSVMVSQVAQIIQMKKIVQVILSTNKYYSVFHNFIPP